MTGLTITTPGIFGAGTGTSLALGGATIGSNALAVTGTALFNDALTVSKSQNSATLITVSNTNAVNTGATAVFSAYNGVANVQLGATCSAYGGFNSLIANMGFISNPAFTAGFLVGNKGPTIFATEAFVEYARLSATGLTMASGTAIKLGNSYVATPQVGTGYLTIQDSTGTTYKVLVAA